MFIYHITTAEAWSHARREGFYEAPSLKTEGFIHCSLAAQVPGVLDRYYTDRSGLLKLVIDPTRLKSPLKYEEAPSIGEEFPHVYGVINLDAVLSAEEVHDDRS